MTDTGSNADIEAVDDVYNEIMYHVLGQFLVTKDNKNIATIFEELVNEFKNTLEIKNTLQELTQEIKTMNREIRDIKNFYSNAVLSNTHTHTHTQTQTQKNNVIDEQLNNLKINDTKDNEKITISSSPMQNIVSSVSAETVADS